MPIELATTALTANEDLPLLLVGPSLGTSVEAVWGSCAQHLSEQYWVVGWDLPGHGKSIPASTAFTVEDLARATLALSLDLQRRQGREGEPFHYAGVSLGGCVGLQLLLDVPDRIETATVACCGAVISEPSHWAERASIVRREGVGSMVAPSIERWFAPGFAKQAPDVVADLVRSLEETDSSSYAAACDALAAFDIRARLGEIRPPLQAIAGDEDRVTTIESLREISEGVRDGTLHTLSDCGHLAPAERPAEIARIIAARTASGRVDPYAAGMRVRRAVLGDAHVDRANAAIDDTTKDFQELITRYAWGSIWTRDGLDRRSRSMITLTALIARGHHDELAMHLRAALTNGLTPAEITEVILQSAIYCGVPDANTAFRIGQQVLREPRADPPESDEGTLPS